MQIKWGWVQVTFNTMGNDYEIMLSFIEKKRML